MDYLNIGSNGFAQVGSQDFFQKNRGEMKVLIEYLNTSHPIPDEFAHMCFYRTKWFSHDFGNYSEIVLMYDDTILNQWDENEPEKFERFWEWFDGVECVDMETEGITSAILHEYEVCVAGKTVDEH